MLREQDNGRANGEAQMAQMAGLQSTRAACLKTPGFQEIPRLEMKVQLAALVILHNKLAAGQVGPLEPEEEEGSFSKSGLGVAARYAI
jgi:hypothetical protein